MNRTEKFWDKRASEYEKNEKKYEQTYSKTVENAKKYLNSSDIVLDFACGTGIITNEIAKNVGEIHGIDISSEMITVAKRKASERKIENITYKQSTIFDESYEKESFNMILAFNILHLVKETEKVIQRIHELLRPEGLFISETPCMGQKKSLLSMLLFLPSKIGLVPNLKFFKFLELEDLVAKGSFQIIETEKVIESPPKLFIGAKKL
jgi:2-polyprenyl-3-methyl-5-hydroxy-6-metoxy-1,4-benzoquinol methylase